MVQQSGSENLHVSSERDITMQKQLSIGSPGAQTLYFWRAVLLKKYKKAQIPCIAPFYLIWTKFPRNCESCCNYWSSGTQIKIEQDRKFLVNSVHFR